MADIVKETPTVSIVCSVMNRAGFIDQTLPSWISQKTKEIIIVDWSSKDNLSEVIKKHQNGTIYRIHVPDKKFYHRTKPHNIGCKFASGDYILKTDSDIALSSELFNRVKFNGKFFRHDRNFMIHNHSFDSAKYNILGTWGTCFLTKEMFEKVNGYNERIESWGHEDDDFYHRIERHYQCVPLHKPMGLHIRHDNVKRKENQPKKFKRMTLEEQRSINCNDNNRNPWGPDSMMEKIKCNIHLPNGKMIKKVI